VFEPSPLLNPSMKLWTQDPTNNETRPYLWQVDIIKGVYDNVSAYPTVLANRQAVALNISRSNVNNTEVWTTLHIRQDLYGQALDAAFRSEISMWVWPTFDYLNNPDLKNPENTFGVEINDGTNLLWFVFADNVSQIFQFPNLRIVLMQTPLKAWSLRQFDIGKEYVDAGWKEPDSLSFTLILGTTWLHPGGWGGYFSGLSATVTPRQTAVLSSSERDGIYIGAGLTILLVIGTAILTQRNKRRSLPLGET